MRKPASVNALEEFGRQRLSGSFFMRDFLYSEIAAFHGIPNIPDDPDLAIAAGTQLCETLLEPLQHRFGRIAIRSAYRSSAVNAFGNEHGLGCASNDGNFAGHIWDRRDAAGHMGATACIVVPSFWDRFQVSGDWHRLAWWVHDHLPYSEMQFVPKLGAFNLTWNEAPKRAIHSYAEPKGWLTRPGMVNHEGTHEQDWTGIEAVFAP